MDSKITCQVDWCDCSDKQTGHQSTAVAYVSIAGHNGSKRMAICASHLGTLQKRTVHHDPHCPHPSQFACEYIIEPLEQVMKKSPHPLSKSRVVLYSFCNYPDRYCEDKDFDFNVEERLAKAKEDGIITNYDDGRNRCPWFEGPPGALLRALRNEFEDANERRK